MSLRRKKLENPVKKKIEYRASSSKKGEGGVFYYYDKATKKDVVIPYPITLVDVDSFGTIVGYNKQKGASIYSNERSNGNIPFTVRYSKKGVMCSGLYKDIKEMIRANGGSYATAVYAIVNKEVVKFIFKGTAMSAWLERPQGDLVTITGTKEETNGATTYQVPVFEARELNQEEVDKIAQDYAYLYEYLDKRDEMAAESQEESEMEQLAQDDDIPVIQETSVFEGMTQEDLALKVEAFHNEQIEDTKGLLDKVPF